MRLKAYPRKNLKLVPETLSEADIQKAVIHRLRADKWLVVRVNSGGFKDGTGRFVATYIIQGINACAGFPDVVAFKGDVKGGRFLMIEIKDAKGTLTPPQERFHQFAALFGITVHIVRHPSELDALWESESPWAQEPDAPNPPTE